MKTEKQIKEKRSRLLKDLKKSRENWLLELYKNKNTQDLGNRLMGQINSLNWIKMTNEEKSELRRQVRFRISLRETIADIVTRLSKQGYKKETIKKYIKSFIPKE